MAERRYTKNGEWVCFDGTHWKVGLAASTAAELGDVTFVEAPAIGRTVTAGEAICALEAVKAAADYYAPVTGTIAAVNLRLATEPQLVNTSPEEHGWILALAAVSDDELGELLDEAAWQAWERGL